MNMKYLKFLAVFALLFSSVQSIAQISEYSAYSVPEKYVEKVEDMNPPEIKIYNQFKDGGASDSVAVYLINVGRTHNNLIVAPSTLIDYSFTNSENGVHPEIVLVNSTVKTIREASLTFEFLNDYDKIIYDIRTGNRYLTMKFKNLVGRPSADTYDEIYKIIFNCIHHLTGKEAVSAEPFVNSTAKSIRLVKSRITYDDGTVSTKITRFVDGDIYRDGPLAPMYNYIMRNYKKRATEYSDNSGDCKVYTIADRMPTFKGNVNVWLAQHLNYPATAAETSAQGKVIVRFIINKDGSVSDAAVIRSVDPELDKEAVRVINSMPRWNPGMSGGKPVRVWFTLPVTFKLQ